MKHVFLMLSIALVVSGCATVQNLHEESKTVYLGLTWDAFAVVADGEIKFYTTRGDKLEERTFILPDGYTSVVGFDIVNIGVVTGNSMTFYTYTAANGWRELPSGYFTLPNGYTDVVGFNQNTMGVVVGNTLIYYMYVQSWMERLSREFTLPNGFESVIGLAPQDLDVEMIGVISDNTLKRYVFFDGRWQETEDPDFILPENYIAVIGLGPQSFGVIIGNALKLYEYWDDQVGFVERNWDGFAFD